MNSEKYTFFLCCIYITVLVTSNLQVSVTGYIYLNICTLWLHCLGRVSTEKRDFSGNHPFFFFFYCGWCLSAIAVVQVSVNNRFQSTVVSLLQCVWMAPYGCTQRVREVVLFTLTAALINAVSEMKLLFVKRMSTSKRGSAIISERHTPSTSPYHPCVMPKGSCMTQLIPVHVDLHHLSYILFAKTHGKARSRPQPLLARHDFLFLRENKNVILVISSLHPLMIII